jgi:hypothetical protein
MSGYPDIDLREQLIRIDLAIAETHKFQQESDKFAAEARKMARDYRLSPILVVGAVATGIGSLLGAITFVLRLSGKG